jgi:nucleotide-binding universal stress UspA family protein
MAAIEKILFPVDFSDSSIAMAPYVRRSAGIFGAKVTLVHVVDPASFNSFALIAVPFSEILEDYLEMGREKLDSFLAKEFPATDCERIVVSGDAATEIARIAIDEDFSMIIMPTHSGRFRQMLLGSTTAKVLNDADCPVLTSRHAETIAPRPLEHREWLCAIGLKSNSERVLRFASQAAPQARGRISIIHAVQSGDPDLPIQLDLKERIRMTEREYATQRITELLENVGLEAQIRIGIGSVKEALLEAARQTDADALIIGRGIASGAHGRMRDLTYAMVRDSPYPVLSI